MSKVRPCRLRVAIPHYFSEVPAAEGYGSTGGERIRRGSALARCLGSVLALARSLEAAVLHIGDRAISRTPLPISGSRFGLVGVEVECHVFVCGDAWLQEILQQYGNGIQVHKLVLDNPRLLPAAARDWLVAANPLADLSLYLEDDLVIADPLFVDKQIWFSHNLKHKAVLMPHRYELTGNSDCPRLYVDGPLRPQFIRRYCSPQQSVAQGKFCNGHLVDFDVASNPHSGCFAVSDQQIEVLRQSELPVEGFIGPLESVATYTVLRHFSVWKPAWPSRDFCTIEHGFPSFLHYLERLPHQGVLG